MAVSIHTVGDTDKYKPSKNRWPWILSGLFGIAILVAHGVPTEATAEDRTNARPILAQAGHDDPDAILHDFTTFEARPGVLPVQKKGLCLDRNRAGMNRISGTRMENGLQPVEDTVITGGIGAYLQNAILTLPIVDENFGDLYNGGAQDAFTALKRELLIKTKIFGPKDDRVDVNWNKEYYYNAVGVIVCEDIHGDRYEGTGWIMKLPERYNNRTFDVIHTDLHVLRNTNTKQNYKSCKFSPGNVKKLSVQIDMQSVEPIYENNELSFGKRRLSRDYYKDRAIAKIPKQYKTGTTKYLSRFYLDWEPTQPNEIVIKLWSGEFVRIDLITYASGIQGLPFVKPDILVARNVRIEEPIVGDLMYWESLHAKRQGSGYLFTNGDGNPGGSGGVLVAIKKSGGVVVVGSFKGYVNSPDLNGSPLLKDLVVRYNSRKVANLILVMDIATKKKVAEFMKKHFK